VVTPEELVGSYAYHSEDATDKPSDHAWDRLTLEGNGTYVLVQGGPTKARSETTGEWHLIGQDGPKVLLDHAIYPVRMRGNEVRLLINDDVAIWYVRTK
jgi:hypothetical protein